MGKLETIRNYVLGVTAASIICAITLCFAEKGPMESLLKLLCGVILTFSLVEPILKISAGDFHGLGIDFQEEAETAAEQGTLQAENTVRELIKQETEAYILDKARELDLQIQVTVTLSREALPVPEAVTIKGTVPPHGKSRLSMILSRELGIEKEKQAWIP